MSDDFDWKKIAVAAGKVVAGVGKVAAGATGGPAAAQGVADAETGIYGALDGFGVQVPGAAEMGPAAKEPPQVTPAAKEVSPKAAPATPGVSPPTPKVTPQLSAPSLVATPPGTAALDMQTLAPERTPGSPPMRTEVTPSAAVQPQKVSQEMSPTVPPDAPSRREPSRLDSFERGGRQAALAPTPSQSAGTFHRVDQFDREATRSRPLPAAPPAPTPHEQESQALIAVLVTAGWSNDEAQVIERGRSAESLRLIGPIVEDSEVRVSAVPIEKVTAQLVKEAPGQVKVSGGSPPWLLSFSRLWLLPSSEKLAMEDRLLSGISDDDPQLLTARAQLPEYVTLARASAVPPAELQRDVGRLPTDQLWLLRAAVAGSKQTGGN
jgi:hypothetical protein